MKHINENIASQTHLADSLSKSFNDKAKDDGKDYISRVYWAVKENSVDFGMPDFNYTEPVFRQKIISDKNAVIDKGKYVVAWKKENGNWKLYRDIANTSMPMVRSK